MQSHNTHIFLAEPTPILELNDWITAYQNSQQRFTFSEAEILQAYWEQGEDILLREDSRFKEVALPDVAFPRQWMLSEHIIANQRIYDSLLHDEWDGKDLLQHLQQLDQQSVEATFHIFCRTDTRFSLSQNEEGLYRICLSQQIAKVSLSTEQMQALESIAEQLVNSFPQQRRSPWTIFELLEQIKYLTSDHPSLGTLLPAELTQWLRQRDEWVKVGRDLWFPQQLLPPPVPNHHYAVLSVNTNKSGQGSSFLEPVETSDQIASETKNQEISDEKQLLTSQQGPTGNRWRITLLTLHLNEGYIPVPSQVRSFYPHKQNRDNIVILSGIWFSDASEMTIWLDMTHHRLYGPDIADQLAFLDAGTILEIIWSNAGFTFHLAGQNPKVFEEEARLIDLTELAQVRSTLLESYRTSLRVLLTSAKQGKGFDELYLELCQRQQHKPSRSTIRAILSSSPEFIFDKTERKWELLPSISKETGASALRKIVVAARQVGTKDNDQFSETVSLSSMIERNRQQLMGLRKFYSGKDQLSD
ncbi:hypothetical protein KSC_001650 [Ktedonobacter sp. SOSP1-52]|uniref:hypothetical protein n=1 Tax=Ktedonobacter sp. SOSP1-52 TaxID=2778366 RepID=UPI001915E270|nr:hypothetical protein [Ktedonobacter sp. SOSP1-52]GHO61273.1 hypothetical protein KSC_001650 [Ktedonobacter sp. SOSP1-52]